MMRIKKLPRWSNQKGQVLVLVALMFLILIAFIGLAIDVGVVFVGYSRLRRAVDSAALSAAGQFRKGYQASDLVEAAEEFLRLNNINDPHATVMTCAEDSTMCTTPPRKLVRVTASSTIPLSFMTVLGFREVTVSAQAVSEAASLDAVIIIDTSESMNSSGSGALNNLKACNEADVDGFADLAVDGPPQLPGECHPFEEVKRAAYEFVGQLFFPYDRVSIVTFDQKVALRLPLEDNKATVQEAIVNLAMMGYDDDGNPATYDTTWLPDCPTELGLCLHAATGGSWCGPLNDETNPWYIAAGEPDPTTCTNTNIGGGVELAGSELATDGRLEALWVIILLTDGAANAGISPSEMSFDPARFDGSVSPYKPWICPNSTWGDAPYCRDDNSADRHNSSSSNYDADDYARDMMDAATHKDVGGVRKQIAYMYTIGLGSQVTNGPGAEAAAGEKLLQYGASADVGQGAYEPAPDATKLREIFRKIAENIATRLSH